MYLIIILNINARKSSVSFILLCFVCARSRASTGVSKELRSQSFSPTHAHALRTHDLLSAEADSPLHANYESFSMLIPFWLLCSSHSQLISSSVPGRRLHVNTCLVRFRVELSPLQCHILSLIFSMLSILIAPNGERGNRSFVSVDLRTERTMSSRTRLLPAVCGHLVLLWRWKWRRVSLNNSTNWRNRVTVVADLTPGNTDQLQFFTFPLLI